MRCVFDVQRRAQVFCAAKETQASAREQTSATLGRRGLQIQRREARRVLPQLTTSQLGGRRGGVGSSVTSAPHPRAQRAPNLYGGVCLAVGALKTPTTTPTRGRRQRLSGTLTTETRWLTSCVRRKSRRWQQQYQPHRPSHTAISPSGCEIEFCGSTDHHDWRRVDVRGLATLEHCAKRTMSRRCLHHRLQCWRNCFAAKETVLTPEKRRMRSRLGRPPRPGRAVAGRG